MEALLSEQRQLHAFLIRGHGLYTLGAGIDDAKRHVEILEFLLEIKGRLYCAGRQ
ncbi:MAG: class II aldolase/adducin family protein [Blastocatellia bacterium]